MSVQRLCTSALNFFHFFPVSSLIQLKNKHQSARQCLNITPHLCNKIPRPGARIKCNFILTHFILMVLRANDTELRQEMLQDLNSLYLIVDYFIISKFTRGNLETLLFLSGLPKKLKHKTDGHRDKFIFYQDQLLF